MDNITAQRGKLGTKRRRRSMAGILRREVERPNSELHKIWEYFVNGSRNYFNSHFNRTKPDSDEITTPTKIRRRKKNSQPTPILKKQTEERERLEDDKNDPSNRWREWGPYLSERQWGTVREDYSEDGSW